LTISRVLVTHSMFEMHHWYAFVLANKTGKKKGASPHFQLKEMEN